jgi:UDP-N-acetyl-D-glucosamine/UDP-N-acetyl-D-galactosamine dehydrogenase
MSKNSKMRICVIGLGYVGLPLAVAFGKKGADVVGFDVKKSRVDELLKHRDSTGEVSVSELKKTKLEYSSDPNVIKSSGFVIVAVPTPIDSAKRPDLCLVEKASETVGRNLKKGAIVVFESTVYPGVTEDICVPIIERESGMKCGLDWFVGYSPERVNPGDKVHTIDKVVKVVSGMTPDITKKVAGVYKIICTAGVHEASSIKVAEAAKVIENTQRDLNIALMNELSVIFHKMGIDTKEVLEAAGTKWNFLKFYPGLVGGHCIGVDPYYLTHKSEELGYHPEVILAGRRINDNMGKWIVNETVKKMIQLGKNPRGSKVLILGITFKENIPDIRNSRVEDIIKEFKEYGMNVEVCDPHGDKEEVRHEYGIELTDWNKAKKADVVVVAVAHDEYKKLSFEKGQILVDVKGIYDRKKCESSGITYWRL